MNKSIIRILLCLVLLLSLSLTSVFAASVNVPYAEPPAGPTDGYIAIEFSGGTTVTTWWHAQASISASTNVVPIVTVTDTGSKIQIDINGNPISAAYNIDYSVSRRTQSYVWLMGSGMTSTTASHSYSYASLGTVKNITYGGLISNLVGFDSRVGSLNLLFDSTQNIYNDVDDIYNTLTALKGIVSEFQDDTRSQLEDALAELGNIKLEIEKLNSTNKQWLEYIFNRLELTNVRLTNIRDILLEFQQTTLDESTEPLPNQGFVDFESSQGSLRDESNVSNNLDTVFNDADFGSFSNGFNVIWSLVDSVLNTNPIFFSLVILVLTLGLLNLIFNRR